jgi:phosphoglycolate phosphatase
LAGFERVIKTFGLTPTFPLDVNLVGPPLTQTLQQLVGDKVEVRIELLVADFKNYYDTEGFKASKLYPGIHKLLGKLHQLGIRMYIATNKRLEPTLSIIKHFNLESIFEEVYAIDRYVDSPFKDKASMIGSLIQKKSINKKNTIYIGDRFEDLEASLANNIEVILVKWGYGNLKIEILNNARYANSAEELLRMIVGSR